MATDLERLVVSLEANIKGFENQMKRAQGVSAGTATKIEREFVAANRNIAGSVGNISAQFQDIGVQLAGGQSPFLIALQQGTQLSAALGNGGLKSTLTSLGAGFASLLSPVSLLTVGVIALGGTAIQQLASWYSEGEKNTKQLEEHARLIQQVADRWGNAVPAIREYATAIADAADKAKLLEVAQGLATEQLQPIVPVITDLRAEVAAAATDFYALGASAESVGPLQTAIAELQTKTSDGTASIEDYRRVQDLLATLLKTGTTPAIDSLSSSLAANVSAFEKAADAASKYRTEAAVAANMKLGPLGSLTPLTSNDGKFMNPMEQQNWTAENTKSQTQIEAEKVARQGRKDAIDREKEAVTALIAELEFEQSILGKTAVERERETALRRAGTAATEEQRQKIAELVNTVYAAREANEATETAAKEAAQAQEQLGRIGQQAVNGFVTALADGRVTGEELVQILSSIVQQLIQMKGFSGLLSGLFGGGFSPTAGGFAAMLGGFNPTAGGFASMLGLPKYANGTNFHPGGMAIVGERGPELLNLPRGSQVIPDFRLPSMARAGGAGSVNAPVVINIDAKGADREGLMRVEAQVAKLKAELPGRIVSSVREANKRNVKFN